LIDGLMRLMAAPDGVTGPINLGNPGEFQIRELAEMVVAMTGSRSEIVYHPLPVDDPTQRKPDISLAKQELGWQPTINLREGLEKTIAYFDWALSSTSGMQKVKPSQAVHAHLPPSNASAVAAEALR
jgi:UDP-glucuronate decarboxylase